MTCPWSRRSRRGKAPAAVSAESITASIAAHALLDLGNDRRGGAQRTDPLAALHQGGGSVADYYIDLLRRPLISRWAMGYGADLRTPSAGIQGPKVMIIDETAGSGGDLLPWMLRKLGLGPLIGKRTWGGLVGILGTPPLMDGGTVTAPNLAFWTEDGFGVENVGIAPDFEVAQTPKDVIAGHDPQLEKAIEVALK